VLLTVETWVKNFRKIFVYFLEFLNKLFIM